MLLQLSYVGRKTAVDSLQIASFAAIIDIDERCLAIRRRARPNALCSLHAAISLSRTDCTRRRSGPWDVCTSMNWGLRGALLTSDHFAAPGQLKLRFSSLFGLDPWHGVPGVMAGRIAGPRL